MSSSIVQVVEIWTPLHLFSCRTHSCYCMTDFLGILLYMLQQFLIDIRLDVYQCDVTLSFCCNLVVLIAKCRQLYPIINNDLCRSPSQEEGLKRTYLPDEIKVMFFLGAQRYCNIHLIRLFVIYFFHTGNKVIVLTHLVILFGLRPVI